MKMVMRSQILSAHIVFAVWLLRSCSTTYGTEADIFCLRSIKESLQDPNKYLQSWDFSNQNEGSICRFAGVECWHPDENRVLNLKLSNMKLEGQFPRGIQNCSSLTGLDLSMNKLSGTIPADISELLKFVTSLNLSSNGFSGIIPRSISNCTYLNVLRLDRNSLSGLIPREIASLARLRIFTVTNNNLTGPVPNFKEGLIPADSYANNPGLCGGPLKACKGKAT